MTVRKPLVLIAGALKELPAGDSVPGAQSAKRVLVASGSGAYNVNWSLYDEVRFTLTGNTAFTFSGATDGQSCVMKLMQDATGSWTVALPSNVRYSIDAPSYTATAAAAYFDRVGFIYDTAADKFDFVSVIKGFA